MASSEYDDSTKTVFYAWQSQQKNVRYLIRDALQVAIAEVNQKYNCANLKYDEATRNEAGAVDIVATIKKKLKNAFCMVADMTPKEVGAAPNPNVLYEVGYMMALPPRYNTGMVDMVFDKSFITPQQLPFDIRHLRSTPIPDTPERKKSLAKIFVESLTLRLQAFRPVLPPSNPMRDASVFGDFFIQFNRMIFNSDPRNPAHIREAINQLGRLEEYADRSSNPIPAALLSDAVEVCKKHFRCLRSLSNLVPQGPRPLPESWGYVLKNYEKGIMEEVLISLSSIWSLLDPQDSDVASVESLLENCSELIFTVAYDSILYLKDEKFFKSAATACYLFLAQMARKFHGNERVTEILAATETRFLDLRDTVLRSGHLEEVVEVLEQGLNFLAKEFQTAIREQPASSNRIPNKLQDFMWKELQQWPYAL